MQIRRRPCICRGLFPIRVLSLIFAMPQVASMDAGKATASISDLGQV